MCNWIPKIIQRTIWIFHQETHPIFTCVYSELTVLLELATTEVPTCVVSERLVKDVISAVDTEWMTMQMGYLSNGGDNTINLSFSERTFLSDSEVSIDRGLFNI